MSIYSQKIRQFVLQVAGRIVRYGNLTQLSDKEGNCEYVSAPEYDPNDGQSSQLPARKLQWFGFRSKPPVGSEQVYVLSSAVTNNKVIIAADTLSSGRLDMVSGESEMFCSTQGTEIFMDQNGQVTISAVGKSSIVMDPNGNVTISGNNISANGSGSITLSGNLGSSITIDAAGTISIVPSAAGIVELGSANPVLLDMVVLYTQLKQEFDAFVNNYNAHTHADPQGGVSGLHSGATVNALSPAVASPNVFGMK